MRPAGAAPKKETLRAVCGEGCSDVLCRGNGDQARAKEDEWSPLLAVGVAVELAVGCAVATPVAVGFAGGCIYI